VFRRLLFVAYFLEVGLLLLLVPWSEFWNHNYFVRTLPIVQAAIDNNYVRGAVSGLGFVNVVIGLSELLVLLSARRPYDPLPPSAIGAHHAPDAADLRPTDRR
jgi:hypothetical protein